MTGAHDNRLHDDPLLDHPLLADGARIAAARLALLFCVFFLIACGLGYPILSRFAPGQTPGLSDVKTYAALVAGAALVEPRASARIEALRPVLYGSSTSSRSCRAVHSGARMLDFRTSDSALTQSSSSSPSTCPRAS